jgi:hypothetical protein
MGVKRSILTIPLAMINKLSVNDLAKTLESTPGSLDAPLRLVVDGYNADARELIQIPEVRRFFKKLNKKFSGWLSPKIDAETIRLLISCLIAEPNSVKTNGVSYEYGVNSVKWASLIGEWCRKSPYGADYAAHLAFELFPMMYPGGKDMQLEDCCSHLKTEIEVESELAIRLINEKIGVLKLKTLTHNSAILCFYPSKTKYSYLEENIEFNGEHNDITMRGTINSSMKEMESKIFQKG